MALTREFKETVMELCKEPAFRRNMLYEALNAYLGADIVTGNALLRDYLNATKSFDLLAAKLEIKEPSLRRMLSSYGNPTAKHLFGIFNACLEQEGIHSVDEFLARA